MRRGVGTLGAGALLAGLVTLAAAADATPGLVTQNINMRAGPGVEYPLVAQLPQGTQTEIFGCLQGLSWCDVAIPGARGWVAGPGLQLVYDDRPEPLDGYGAAVGLPLVGFDVDSYWGHHYRGRPWFHDEARWRGAGFGGRPAGPYPGPYPDRGPDRGPERGPERGGLPGGPGFRPPGIGHPVGPAPFVNRPPPDAFRGPERGPDRGPGPATGPGQGPVVPGPGPAEPARVQPSPGPRFQPGPQGSPAGHPGPGPGPGRPAEPHGGREPPR